MPETAEIVIIDDDPSFLRALTRQVDLMGHSTVPFTDAKGGIRHLKSGRGDCVIVDLYLTDTTGLDVQDQLAGLPVPIVFLSGQATIRSTVQAMQNGAVTFLEKPIEYDDLARAVKTALQHGDELRSLCSAKASAKARFDALTDRQKDVFRVLITGAPNKVIARELGIGERTVKAHRHDIMERLQAETIADIYKLASELDEPLPDPARPL